VPVDLYIGNNYPKRRFWGPVFGDLQNPYAEIRKFLTGACSRKTSHVCCFIRGLNRRRISVRKAVLYRWQKNQNTFWCRLVEPPWSDFPNFLCECLPCFHTGVVFCLEQDADLHTAQLMPLPLTVSCFSKSRLVLPFWYRLTCVVPDKGPLNGCVCVCACVHCGPPHLCSRFHPNPFRFGGVIT